MANDLQITAAPHRLAGKRVPSFSYFCACGAHLVIMERGRLLQSDADKIARQQYGWTLSTKKVWRCSKVCLGGPQ